MGDVQQYFIDKKVRNFYSVSISGYHIAEAGANPISQLAFTLANGFTYVEYYLSRGMDINAFAPNLSFFFSNGMDPEYAVMGRVARRLWAKALKHRYGADERSQMPGSPLTGLEREATHSVADPRPATKYGATSGGSP
jgi:methylmalonyl-CoA mutase